MMPLPWVLVNWCCIICIFLQRASAQIQLLNITGGFYPELSATCVSVLNQAVACDASIGWAGQGRFESDETLTALCTTACLTALTTWQRRVIGACTMRFNNGEGSLVLPQIWPQSTLDQYNLLCLQQSGLFCNAVIRGKAGINPDDQKQTASAVSTLLCEDCMIKSMSAQQQMQLQSISALGLVYSSRTSSCKKTTFTFTPIVTTSYFIPATGTGTSSSTAIPSPSACVGTSYTIKAADTCKSISKSNGISTDRLLRTNNLPSFCSSFPATGKVLCISTNDKCTTYTVKIGDTCASIGTTFTRTWTQIVTWNPELDQGCLKIAQYVGYEICVSQPGGTWVNASPPIASATSTLPVRTGTPVGSLPAVTYVSPFNFTDFVYGNETRTDCARYSTGAEMPQNGSCAAVAEGFDETVQNLLDWNPSLSQSNPCALDPSTQYCVQRLRRVAPNITEFCTLKSFARPGISNLNFIANWGITLDVFAMWNPTVKPDGTGYKTGYEYCVMANHFKQPGIVSTCNGYAMANITSFLSNPCQIIETKYGLTHARFVAWNPALLSNCTGILAGADYCVSIPNFKPVYTSTTAIVVQPSITGGIPITWTGRVTQTPT